MTRRLRKIDYNILNARQKESWNFQKVSAVFADYAFITIRLSDDWNGADFVAQHLSGTTLNVQLKGRLSFCKKYLGKKLQICFRDGDQWYLYPHDPILKHFLLTTKIADYARTLSDVRRMATGRIEVKESIFKL